MPKTKHIIYFVEIKTRKLATIILYLYTAQNLVLPRPKVTFKAELLASTEWNPYCCRRDGTLANTSVRQLETLQPWVEIYL